VAVPVAAIHDLPAAGMIMGRQDKPGDDDGTKENGPDVPGR
jgi:hypothetical protein